jgi:hypothetical protein
MSERPLKTLQFFETSKLNTFSATLQMATISECRYRWLRVPDLNLSIDGIVQLIHSTADLIMVRNAHRRRPKPPIVRLRCPSLGETVMSFAFDCQQTIEITPQCCWRATVDEDGHYSFAVAL